MDDLYTDRDAADILELSLGDLSVLADELGIEPDRWSEDDLEAARELLEDDEDEGNDDDDEESDENDEDPDDEEDSDEEDDEDFDENDEDD